MERKFLNKKDIMEMFNCCETSAINIIKGIKSVSDTIGLKGKVTELDLNLWLNRNSPKKQHEEFPQMNFTSQLSQLLVSLIKNELKQFAQVRFNECMQSDCDETRNSKIKID